MTGTRKSFIRKNLLDHADHLRLVGLGGTILICVGAFVGAAAYQQRVRAWNVPNLAAPSQFRSPPESSSVPITPEDGTSNFRYLSMVVLALVMVGHRVSRWSAIRQGVLSASKEGD
ncbi:hypothetical protein [Roseiconus lacunae]|uniref:hypothetical protein n=1 Tax=Roseiconus lacunae TaxID=2605694 RepID=UPI001E427FE2|nr:hypothetical protein [Roseiconus lacunae]